MRVIKFGGTSIGTPECFLNVVQIISERGKKDDIIVVLSAIGGVTDKIINAINLAKTGSKDYQIEFDEIKLIHNNFLSKVVSGQFLIPAEEKLNRLLTNLFEKLKGVFLLNECTPRVSDSIITLGEYLSCSLLVNSLKSFGKEAEFYDACGFIKTNSSFGDAIVNFELTDALIQNKFNSLKRNHIPIVNGFTGSDENGQITSLGRNGSDYSATIIGGALKAGLVEIWTDVDGVLSADPKLVAEAYTLDELSYEEAGSLAVLGGKVIHPKTIVPVEKQNVPISILNTFRPGGKGTYIGKAGHSNGAGIKTITYLKGISIVSVNELEPGFAQKIFLRLFSLISRLDLPIITMSKSTTHQSISFVTHQDFAQYFVDEIKKEFVLETANKYIGDISWSNSLALISAIGITPESNSTVTRKILDTLETQKITAMMFLNDPNSQNISFIVNHAEVKKTITVLHGEFFRNKVRVNVA